jgi:hypothetical protein
MKNKQQPPVAESMRSNGSNTPILFDAIWSLLPPLMQNVLACFVLPREKDIGGFGFITAFSGLLPKVKVAHNGGYTHANLFFLTVTPPTGGKGKIECVKRMFKAVHDKLVSESINAIEAWTERKKNKEGCSEPKPPFKKLFLSLDASLAAIVRQLIASLGAGILIETEVATLRNVAHNTSGNLIPFLCKVFHNESYQKSKVNDEEFNLSIDSPCCSVLLAGTMETVRDIVNHKDGFASRCSIYTFDDISPLSDNLFSEPSDSGHNEETIAKAILNIYTRYWDMDIKFIWTDNQKESLRNYWKEIDDATIEEKPEGGISTVRRAILSSTRIAALLSLMRYAELDTLQEINYIADEDAEIAKVLSAKLLEHSFYYNENLPQSSFEPTVFGVKMKRLLALLPDRFEQKDLNDDFYRKAEMKPRTLKRHLKLALAQGFLFRENHGIYVKSNTDHRITAEQ